MELSQKISKARREKGLTQEQLADLANVTVRTIQRIESGDTVPRAHTLKAIAVALDVRFEELLAEPNTATINTAVEPVATAANEAGRHVLFLLCISCFSYLLVPLIHFLLPIYILKKATIEDPGTIAFAQKIIRQQLYWAVALCLVLLATLAYNLMMTAYFQKQYLINYLLPFFVLFLINALLITGNLFRIKQMQPAAPVSN